jgi:hypothetical protein
MIGMEGCQNSMDGAKNQDPGTQARLAPKYERSLGASFLLQESCTVNEKLAE